MVVLAISGDSDAEGDLVANDDVLAFDGTDVWLRSTCGPGRVFQPGGHVLSLN